MLARHLLPWLVLISAVTGYAQAPNNAHPVANQSNPSLDRRIEVLIRSQFSVRPDFDMTLGARTTSDTAGFDQPAGHLQPQGQTNHRRFSYFQRWQHAGTG